MGDNGSYPLNNTYILRANSVNDLIDKMKEKMKDIPDKTDYIFEYSEFKNKDENDIYTIENSEYLDLVWEESEESEESEDEFLSDEERYRLRYGRKFSHRGFALEPESFGD